MSGEDQIFSRMREVKSGAREWLFAIPGVHCVAIGTKRTGGRDTDQPAIVVHVNKKRPLGDLEPGEAIPAEIDGVKVDVIESPVPYLLSADESPYDPLRGGIQIKSGGDARGEGTLGFIAQSSDGQKIYAVTNQHVLLVNESVTSGLEVTPDPKDSFATSVRINFKGPLFGAVDAGTVVTVRILGAPSQQGSFKKFAVIYSTPEGAHESDVAKAIRDELNVVGLVNATWQQGASFITVTPGAELAKIDVLTEAFGKKLIETAGLSASVVGNAISFSGQAADPGGAFVNLNVGGQNPSYGLFVPIAEGDDGTTVATNTVTALSGLKNSPRLSQALSGVTVQRNGAQVTISGVEEVECDIAKDDRVGQPNNTFCCRHHKCCSDRIGRVVAAALDLDAALIQLDGEQKYIAKVEGIPENDGAVHNTAVAKKGDHVQKRGRTTDLTTGTVSAVDADGVIGFKSKSRPFPSFFHRYYQNALRIESDSSTTFSEGGDSGAAVMDHSNNIVGLLFGGGDGATHGVATPIGEVLKAFASLNLVVATTTDTSKAQTVPGPSFNFAALPADQAVSPVVGGTPLWEGLRKAEVEIEAIPAGKDLSEAVRRNVKEGFHLVNTNRRVGAVWKRNGGQQIFPALLRMLHNPSARLPEDIAGRPLAECLSNIRRIFERYGSPGLIADLRQWGDQVIGLMSLSYDEMKSALQTVQQPM
jgi:hypothetical protein